LTAGCGGNLQQGKQKMEIWLLIELRAEKDCFISVLYYILLENLRDFRTRFHKTTVLF